MAALSAEEVLIFILGIRTFGFRRDLRPSMVFNCLLRQNIRRITRGYGVAHELIE